MGKAFCIDLGARLSVRLFISALLSALTSEEYTLSATGHTSASKKRPNLLVNVQIAIILHKNLVIYFSHIRVMENTCLDIGIPQSVKEQE